MLDIKPTVTGTGHHSFWVTDLQRLGLTVCATFGWLPSPSAASADTAERWLKWGQIKQECKLQALAGQEQPLTKQREMEILHSKPPTQHCAAEEHLDTTIPSKSPSLLQRYLYSWWIQTTAWKCSSICNFTWPHRYVYFSTLHSCSGLTSCESFI